MAGEHSTEDGSASDQEELDPWLKDPRVMAWFAENLSVRWESLRSLVEAKVTRR